MRRPLALLAGAAALTTLVPLTARADTPSLLPTARAAQPVVLTGAQVPDWSRLPATGTPMPYPSGATDGVRDAHNGTLVVPPDARTGAPVDRITAWRWDGTRYVAVPVQVDQRFPYFLANGRSSFSTYSGTDTELTYQWDTEAWKMTAGICTKAYPAGQGPTADPVPTLDDDDEIAFMASDAGGQAPAGAAKPKGATDRQEVALADPLRPGAVAYVYLFLSPTRPKTASYVRYQRDADSDQWIDKGTFADSDPEKLGTSNTSYGPNLEGSVCDADGTVRASTDRFPRDGVTVSTGAYRWHASGRWMIRSLQVANRGRYGLDLIDRWKGRAFQQSPDSSVSLVGFEDEQVNWEANSALLGERVGPVRAIREVWGADSGTNVTKTETFYRDAVAYRYHLRVHPIPPDGLYTSWDYNHGVATRYFNALKPEGVAIDGQPDDVGGVDSIAGQPAYFDAPDPTFDLPLAMLKWEQVSGSGRNGSLVYVLEPKGATTFTNPAVVPYYRDDACFDDGTGDDPVARPWPGEASTDPRVQAAYGTKPCDQRQGAWGANGVHFFVTHDSDNAFVGSPTAIDEVDAQQWQFAVPTDAPTAVGEPYANDVRAPLVVTVRS
ncbi:MAG: S-layer y protein [Actinomycetia bacterium]|nr:S-layer y protein [Actinomycetes bacterium]